MAYKSSANSESGWRQQMYAGLIGMVGFVVLLAARIQYDGSTKYLFMLANLGLAWLAWATGVALLNIKHRRRWLPAIVLLGLVWLAMLPNTFYVVTDFIHVIYAYEKIGDFSGENFVRTPDIVPAMLDIALMAAATWTAGLLGVLSLDDVRKRVLQTWGSIAAFLLSILALFGSSYAIYLGRSPRLNSWDAVTNPGLAIDTVASSFANADERTVMLQLTLSYFVLLSLCFFGVVTLQVRSK